MKKFKAFENQITIDWSSLELTESHLQYANQLKEQLTRFRDSYLSAHHDLYRLMGDYSVEIIVSVKI